MWSAKETGCKDKTVFLLCVHLPSMSERKEEEQAQTRLLGNFADYKVLTVNPGLGGGEHCLVISTRLWLQSLVPQKYMERKQEKEGEMDPWDRFLALCLIFIYIARREEAGYGGTCL